VPAQPPSSSPAQAGDPVITDGSLKCSSGGYWMPAFAGMTSHYDVSDLAAANAVAGVVLSVIV
jgi:hypothetical protein